MSRGSLGTRPKDIPASQPSNPVRRGQPERSSPARSSPRIACRTEGISLLRLVLPWSRHPKPFKLIHCRLGGSGSVWRALATNLVPMEGAWEYRQVSASANRQDDESFNDVRKRARETWETNLNDLGDQGWELVSSERDSE